MEQGKKPDSTLKILTIIVAVVMPLVAVYYGYYLSKNDRQKNKSDIINPDSSIQNSDSIIQKSKIFPDSAKISINPDKKTAPQSPPKTELQMPPKKELESPQKKVSQIILKFTCVQNDGLVFSANGELKIVEANTISGELNYTLTSFPYKYRNERILQGRPTATELVKGSIIRDAYIFTGERIINDSNGLYALGAYEIYLNSDGTLKGVCKGINVSSNFCDLVGTYKVVE